VPLALEERVWGDVDVQKQVAWWPAANPGTALASDAQSAPLVGSRRHANRDWLRVVGALQRERRTLHRGREINSEIMLHVVSPSPRRLPPPSRPTGAPKQFAQQIANVPAASSKEVLHVDAGRKPLPPRPVRVTAISARPFRIEALR